MPSPLKITRLTGFGRGKSETHDAAVVVLGTDAAAHVRFDLTWDKTVSGRHAEIQWREDSWWLEDRSRDGTFVTGRKVTAERLAPGVILELGKGGPTIRLDWEAAPAPVAPAPAPVAVPPSPPPAAVAPARPAAGRPRVLPVWAYGAALLAILGVGLTFHFLRAPGGAADAALAASAERQAAAVALVVGVLPAEQGGAPFGIATAWAVEARLFATNAHVTEAIEKVLKRGGACHLVLNRNPERRLRVQRVVTHPRFGRGEVGFEGKPSAVSGYDVGLIETAEPVTRWFRVAGRPELEKVDSGYRIAYLGFPMEGMAGGGVDVRSPVATMQSGIVTSATDFWLSKADFPARLLIQHNLGAAGGASGSPLFNAEGEVVALLSAGNIAGRFERDGSLARAPSAVMVNFAQRVDLLREIWPGYPP